MNIVSESWKLHAGLVFFQNLAFFGWVSHSTHVLYLQISCQNDVAKRESTIYGWVFQSPPKTVSMQIKSAAMETIKKRIEKKNLFFQHRFGKILLNKVYNCALCEKSDKLFCYWKLNFFFPFGWVLQFLWCCRISFRFSTFHSPLQGCP
jgi:hypothetical protein